MYNKHKCFAVVTESVLILNLFAGIKCGGCSQDEPVSCLVAHVRF